MSDVSDEQTHEENERYTYMRRITLAAAKLDLAWLYQLADDAETLVESKREADERYAEYAKERAERAEFEAWKASRGKVSP